MKKLIGMAVVTSLLGVSFVAGVATGKAGAKESKFVTREEVKFEDLGGPKLGNLNGDFKKGAYAALMQLPAGFTTPLHSHGADYEAVQIEGTSTHWMKGEDGTKAKKLTPGSYWSMPGKSDHVSQCEKGKDCVVLVWQKAKFDFKPVTEAAPAAVPPTKTAPAAVPPTKPAAVPPTKTQPAMKN